MVKYYNGIIRVIIMVSLGSWLSIIMVLSLPGIVWDTPSVTRESSHKLSALMYTLNFVY